jgi:hypothetical protein
VAGANWPLRAAGGVIAAGFVAWILWGIAPGASPVEVPHTDHQIAVPDGILTFDFPTDYTAPHGHHELYSKSVRYFALQAAGWQELSVAAHPDDRGDAGIYGPDMQNKPYGARISKGWLIQKLWGGDDVDVRVSVRVPTGDDLRGHPLRILVGGGLNYPEKQWFSNTFEVRTVPFEAEVLTAVATGAEAEAHETYMLWRSVLGWFALAALALGPIFGIWALTNE